ncbi:GumC family protein [Microvirga makkahensis]|uniref:Polysaccharide chain length determinant protein, PEP-CTERM locus subfamily n=1 Tax=Microvirga makkahensis TaxID=1128670 RepID=A0A7X3SQP9_9HYPH|nr:hypothetical protein [Microvirga makkahensis]MXQ13742.1 hypothetical protein [Microvirga makkahensis]
MEQGSERGIQHYLDLLKRRFGLVAGIILLLAAVGAAVVFSLPRIYRGEAAILVDPPTISASLGEPGRPYQPTEPLQLAEQRVLTRENLLRLAEKFDLFTKRRASLTPVEIADLMRERTRIARIEVGPAARPPNSPTFTFTVEFEYENPELAAAVADELAHAILNEDVRARTSRAGDAVQLLGREVKDMRGQIAAIEDQISGLSQKNIDVLPGRPEFQMTQLEAKRSDLAENDAAIRSLDDERRLLDLELRMKAVGGSAPASDTQALEMRLQEMKEQLVDRTSVYSDKHPEVRTLKQQIVSIEEQIRNASSRAELPGHIETSLLPPNLRLIAERIRTLEDRRIFLDERRQTLQASISALQIGIAQAPEVEAALRTLQGRRDALQRSLDELTGRLTAAELVERLEQDERSQRLKLIERPIVPDKPAKPNRLKLLIVVLGAAVIAGFGTVLALDFLDQTIRSANEVRSATGGMPVTCIPKIMTRREARRRRIRRTVGTASVGSLMLVLLFAAHTYVMPVQQIWEKVELFRRN